MDDMAARIAVYEASSDPVLRSHLPGMYNAMANYQNQRNAKLIDNGARGSGYEQLAGVFSQYQGLGEGHQRCGQWCWYAFCGTDCRV